MEPTSQGEIVIAHCRRMVSTIETVQSELKANGARVSDLSRYLTWEILEAAEAVLAVGGVSAAANIWGNPNQT